jgi:Domain of unknown function (DUF4168)
MMARGKRILPMSQIAAVLVAAGALTVPAFGQNATTHPAPATSPAYSDATLAKAGHALRDVLAINQTYRDKMVATSDPAARSHYVADARQQATAAVTRDCLTLAQYNQILGQARQDPALRTRLLSAAGIPSSAQ